MKPLISVVVPVFNEAKNVPRLIGSIQDVFAPLAYEYEILFVDDGSTDGSPSLMEDIQKQNSHVGFVALSRNFGKEVALSAGIAHARGTAVVLIDADLQHPPALIPELIREWEGGADVAIGVRRPYRNERMVRRFFSKLFAFTMNLISDVKAPQGATDFRLLDRKVADAFLQMDERQRLARSLIDWLGFTRVYVPFNVNEDEGGTSGYSYSKLFASALSAIIAHSKLPLFFAGYLGIGITLFAGLLGAFIIVEQFILGDPLLLDISVLGMVATMILFLNGVVLVSLGLMALYIDRIQQEAIGRPLYVVKKMVPSGAK